MSLFVFDFDGVLFDTARECLAVAYEAARRSAELHPKFRDWSDPAPPSSVADSFLTHRHWVGPPWQYAVLLECIADGDLPSDTEAFLAIAAARRATHERFTDVYFATRSDLARDVERWCAVITPYEAATRSFVAMQAREAAAVLSTRDDASIRRLLRHFLGITLADDELLPRSGPREKWQILLETARSLELAPGRIFFVDDYLHHAGPAHQHGIAAQLATWGYLAPDDARNARAAGVPCLELENLERAIALHEEAS